MSGGEALPTWAVFVLVPLLVGGGSIVLIGALGLLRLPSFYQRIHGPAITTSLGTGCVLAASMLYFSLLQSRWVLHELVLAAFVLMTAPVVAMLIIRAAVYRDLRTGKRDSGVDQGGVYRFADAARPRQEEQR